MSPRDDKDSYSLPHPIWSEEDVMKVEVTHTPPTDKVDKVSIVQITNF